MFCFVQMFLESFLYGFYSLYSFSLIFFFFSAFTSFPFLSSRLENYLGKGGSFNVETVSFSPDLSSMLIITWRDDQAELVELETPLICDRIEEIKDVSYRCSFISTIVEEISKALSNMHKVWEQAKKDFNSVFSRLREQTKRISIFLSTTDLLTFSQNKTQQVHR